MIATHYEGDFSEHYLADLLAARGCSFLGWNTRYRGNGEFFRLAGALDDIAVGVRWLRQAGRRHPGGAARQLRRSLADVRLPEPGLGGLEPADGAGPGDLFIALCAHPGRPDVLTTWLDPSVTDEFDPLSVDPGAGHVQPVQRTALPARVRGPLSGRSGRPQRAHHPRRPRGVGSGSPRPAPATGSSPCPVPGRTFALRTSASIRPIGRPVATPVTRAAPTTAPAGLASSCSLRTWLDMWSLSDSSCRGSLHLPRITEPALVVQSTGDQGCFLSDAHTIYDQLGSADKSLELVPGEHYLRTPAGARDQVADLIAGWIAGHGA